MSSRPAKRQVALVDLMSVVPGSHAVGGTDAIASTTVSGVEIDSRLVEPGDLFAALPGHRTHGAVFSAQAVALGATAILTDEAGLAHLAGTELPVVVVPSPRRWLGAIAARAYGEPAAALTLMGVTGTNGKTTVTHMLEAGLLAAGRHPGVIGTLGARAQGAGLPTARTTPEAVHLHAILGAMREHGVDAVAMEVSSIALCEGRVDGLRFAVAGFTNLSQDHLDYHGTMEAYFDAKASLFTPERADLGIVGVDDEWGRRLAATAPIPLRTWSALGDSSADWRIEARGGLSVVHGPQGEAQEIRVPMPGAFNRANAVCAYAMLRAIGVTPAAAAEGIAAVQVPGRMEIVGRAGGVTGIVDYAHSPDAIERVVTAVREVAEGRVIVVIGAGGDRDRVKRPLMGRAARLADVVIVTDDNPRSEDPAVIREAVFEGVGRMGDPESARIVPDRRTAIAQAVAGASSGDIVLVLGKGHEQGQEIAGVVHPFDDRETLRRALLPGDAGVRP